MAADETKVVFNEQGARRIVAAVKAVERQAADVTGEGLANRDPLYPAAIVARLTAQDGTDAFRWAWTEQEWDDDAGDWVDRPHGRTGTVTDRSAITLDPLDDSSDVGDVVTLVRRSARQADGTVKPVWAIGGGNASLPAGQYIGQGIFRTADGTWGAAFPFLHSIPLS